VTVKVVVPKFHICVPHSLKISVKTDSRQFERSNLFHQLMKIRIWTSFANMELFMKAYCNHPYFLFF